MAEFLRRDPLLHLYGLGDLDPFYWPHTRWFGGFENGHLTEVVLLYFGSEEPVLLAFSRCIPSMQTQLELCIPHLPSRFYAHLSEGLRPLAGWDWQDRGLHLRLGLTAIDEVRTFDVAGVERLQIEDLAEIQAFFEVAYPENFFDARMLQTGKYFGWRDPELLCVAGIHTHCPGQRVAALGNIATHPEARGKGLASRVTACLCQDLLTDVDTIGLNVEANNLGAIRCYQRLGFAEVARYREFACVVNVSL